MQGLFLSMIKRHLEDKAIKLLKSFPALGIIGPRQCGKTTFVKMLAERIKKKSVYIDLELTSDYRKLSNPELFLRENIDKCIIIDEIQRYPELFPLLRALIDEKRIPSRFIVLGSANPLMIKYSSESLAGRIAYLELSPFSINEVCDKHTLNNHWFKGGFPRSLLAKSNYESSDWLEFYVTNIIERDLISTGVNASPIVIRNVLEIIAHYHGGILNVANISKSTGISAITINKYLDLLEGFFIIRRLYPYFTNTKKRLVKSPKIFIRDAGILHKLLNINSFNSLLGNINKGNSWEGYAIEQICSNISPNFRLFFYRTQDGSEIDLVITKSTAVVASVEIKISPKPSLSKGNYFAIKSVLSKKNFVLVPDSVDYPIEKNIRVCGVIEFLEKHLPKL